MPKSLPNRKPTPLRDTFFRHAAILAHKPDERREYLVGRLVLQAPHVLETVLIAACNLGWKAGDDEAVDLATKSFAQYCARARGRLLTETGVKREARIHFESLVRPLVARVYREYLLVFDKSAKVVEPERIVVFPEDAYSSPVKRVAETPQYTGRLF